MLVFFVIIIFLILILSLSIGLKIENFRMSNYEEKKNDIKVFLLIYLFRIKIASISIRVKDMKKIYNKESLRFYKLKVQKNLKEIKNILKSLEIKSILLNINIGTENVIFTTYIIVILSTILSSILPLYLKDKNKESYYKIQPIYEDKLKYKIELNCIMTIKIVHIIHIIYLILRKRRDEKYVRTSNRRSYESSYE